MTDGLPVKIPIYEGKRNVRLIVEGNTNEVYVEFEREEQEGWHRTRLHTQQLRKVAVEGMPPDYRLDESLGDYR